MLNDSRQTQLSNFEQILGHADQLREQGDLAGAEQAYRQVLDHRPDSHAAYHGLALIAHAAGKPQLSMELVQNAIALNANVPMYHSNLCEMYRRAGRLDDAILAGKNATGLKPDSPDFKYNLALAYADKQEFAAAIILYQEIVRHHPGHGLACNNLGAALEKSGEIDEALRWYRKAVELNPEHAEAQNNLGAIYSERGQLNEARECFSAAIGAKPDFIEPYYNLSSLKTYSVGDPDLTGLKKLMKAVPILSIDEQIRYFFALGKAFEDIAEYQDAFTAYQRGNQLKFSQIQYNDRQAKNIINRIRTIFTEELFENHNVTGSTEATPVFIVGMPRSGTSLIEQILASHGSIFGAGELVDLHAVILDSCGNVDEGKIFASCEPGLPGFDFIAMAAAYLKKIRKHDQKALHITDKMPANFFYIGFIQLMFPNAKIIHAMRHPMDSCFSCYSRLFNDTMDFTYNLETLGHYFIRYMDLMEHWHQVLPEGRILDVVYEEVVAGV